ncbi:MAG TPA: VOC family protein [Anaerolineales bacterium]|jgi:methylmalonyl-CoA/ethylmalonyl-CoA epimerase
MAADPDNSLGPIGQVSVPVTELARAVKFYQEQLRLPFLFEVPGMAFFDCSPTRLLLTMPEEGDQPPGCSILYFRVDDVQQAAATLEKRGVAFLQSPHRVATMPDHELWMAFFADSEGNTMALMGEIPNRRPA